MRQDALTAVLLIKAVEETDAAGTLIPPAERAAATREAVRNGGSGGIADGAVTRLGADAQRLLEQRAELLRSQLVVRYPFVDTLLGLMRGPAWAGWLLIGLALMLGGAMSALDGSRRINILAFPLLGLVVWNFVVYVLIALNAVRALAHRAPGRASPAVLMAHWLQTRIRRAVARSAVFNAPLAEALSRFVAEWSAAARPLLTRRSLRLFHLCAAAVGVGLIAGLYLRGVVLDYRAGWESTFLGAEQVRAVVAVLYGPASALTGIAIPGAEHVAALRWEGGSGGENAARWIHLLAATALLFIVVPRLLLALAATLSLWNRARKGGLPSSLVPYFRAIFASAGMGQPGIVAVMPYAYEPAAGALAALRKLLPAALGEGIGVDVHNTVRYGDEDDWLRNLGAGGAPGADVIVLLFSLAATPEDENHGTVIAAVRKCLERTRTQLLVLVDEGPYLARMERTVGAERVGERCELWRAFVAARGLAACFADLRERQETSGESVRRVRATLWRPAVDG